jgi:hypothetical protein
MEEPCTCKSTYTFGPNKKCYLCGKFLAQSGQQIETVKSDQFDMIKKRERWDHSWDPLKKEWELDYDM